MKKTSKTIVRLAAACCVAATLAAPAAAVDDETLAEVLEVLREEGMIDDDRHAEMSARLQKKADLQSWLDRISIWGDFRARYESFFFERDVVTTANGDRLPNRHRGRYRARLNLSGGVNDHATIYVRLASGSDDARSTNQSFGRGVDFDTDDIRLDLAYVTLTPFAGGALCCIDGGYLGVDVGKVKNPFIWKAMNWDGLVFDSDLNPEGTSLRIRGDIGPVRVFASTGFYILDENTVAPAKDPNLLAGQIGGSLDLGDSIEFGTRGSIYSYASLDDAFFTRAAAGGNIADGIARRNGSIQIVEAAAYIDLDFSELFPVHLFGSYAHNLSARTSIATGASRNDDAYSAGIFIGDKATLAKLGFVYFAIQANALPSMFIDSNNTDGVTNRDGYRISLQRKVYKNIEFVYQLFLLNRLRGGPAFVDSIPGSDRVRMSADLKFKF